MVDSVTGLVARKPISTELCQRLELSETGERWSSDGPSSELLPALTRNTMIRWRNISVLSITCVWRCADECLLMTMVCYINSVYLVLLARLINTVSPQHLYCTVICYGNSLNYFYVCAATTKWNLRQLYFFAIFFTFITANCVFWVQILKACLL